MRQNKIHTHENEGKGLKKCHMRQDSGAQAADKQGQYQYYRVECSGSDGGYALAELTMNY